ncbi:hypothetical protein ANN_05015 [Periplaneta americana]|uniref:Uncharacterized protein n=1 Tax=Periplaneta americana TaxID=6978 RepID=A0ABQ8TBT0_PERAM|nr:hypothetical protein ANN_05015 [Periplaneta americana]
MAGLREDGNEPAAAMTPYIVKVIGYCVMGFGRVTGGVLGNVHPCMASEFGEAWRWNRYWSTGPRIEVSIPGPLVERTSALSTELPRNSTVSIFPLIATQLEWADKTPETHIECTQTLCDLELWFSVNVPIVTYIIQYDAEIGSKDLGNSTKTTKKQRTQDRLHNQQSFFAEEGESSQLTTSVEDEGELFQSEYVPSSEKKARSTVVIIDEMNGKQGSELEVTRSVARRPDHYHIANDNNALSESAMRISYKICHEIAKELKTFNERNFIKRCLIILADELCPQQVREVKAIRLLVELW